MKRNLFYLTVICATMLASCGERESVKGISAENLDTSVVPGDDFYRFACGGWMASHPLKPDYARFGTFDELSEKSNGQVKDLIAELSQKQLEQGSLGQTIGDIYTLAMDSARRNAEGARPVLPYLKQLNSLADKSELSAVLAVMSRSGVQSFFSHYVYADEMNSSINIFHIKQGGYRMGDRDYYLEKDERSQALRTKYVEYIEKLFTLSGYTAEEAKKISAAVMKIETQLATVALSREALRDPIANYHKIKLDELKQRVPNLDWDIFFKTIGIKGLEELNAGQLEPLTEVNKIIKEASLQDIKYYLQWNVLNTAASYLSDDFTDADFEYYDKTLSGKEQQEERWKQAVGIVNGCVGEGVGQMYVEKYFPPMAKEKMINLVKNLQTALGERINQLPWMGDETKAKAQEKLATFHVKIGYPDKWRDYSALKIRKEDSYLENIIRSNVFDYEYMISRFNQPVDKDEWLMNPQTVNAYYNPATNEICFPAAILQPPFFDVKAADAVNYGAIGVVIGHEMTHGFDDQGRKYDKDGNLTEWWTENDAQRFQERAQVLADFFDNIVVLDTIHGNGRLTLGENIADQGGLQVSWQAYQNSLKGKTTPEAIDGYTDAQQFFIAYATVWAANIREAEILRRTKMDPHSLGKWRTNGALPQIDAWYEAFGVSQENALYVPKDKRVSIW
ncbi:MAG: M13 family metallopeptidase [Bacteroidales bacterium]|jgi:putative endopeptidase|nr:M13 family metallopeptidase [Bacteroidales bacterium]